MSCKRGYFLDLCREQRDIWNRLGGIPCFAVTRTIICPRTELPVTPCWVLFFQDCNWRHYSSHGHRPPLANRRPPCWEGVTTVSVLLVQSATVYVYAVGLLYLLLCHFLPSPTPFLYFTVPHWTFFALSSLSLHHCLQKYNSDQVSLKPHEEKVSWQLLFYSFSGNKMKVYTGKIFIQCEAHASVGLVVSIHNSHILPLSKEALFTQWIHHVISKSSHTIFANCQQWLTEVKVGM